MSEGVKPASCTDGPGAGPGSGAGHNLHGLNDRGKAHHRSGVQDRAGVLHRSEISGQPAGRPAACGPRGLPQCHQPLFLGVDGGGTGTEACVTDAGGTVLGRGRGGPSNINYVSEHDFANAVSSAISESLGQAGISIGDLTGACLALAGAGGDNPARIRRAASPVLKTCPFLVVEDTYSALAAAHAGNDGIVVIAGTGSNCLGVRNGRYASAGGYGALLADEGSGYKIAVQGLRAVLRSYDGRQGPTALTDLLMSACGAKSPRDFIAITLDLDRPGIAALSKPVFEAAERGDETALLILREQASELAELAKAVSVRLGMESPDVATRGGCFRNPCYLQAFEEALREAIPEAEPANSERPAAEGAAILAIDHFLKGVGQND